MSLGALGLVILAGLIHASWNIVAKSVGGDARFALFTALTLTVVWSPVGLWVAWDAVPRWGGLEWALVAGSSIIHVAYYIVLLRGYRLADLTVVYPVARGSGPLLSSTFALLFMGEQLSVLGASGVAGIVAGVFLIAGGPALWRAVRPSHGGHDGAAHADAQARRDRVLTGLRYGALTGVFIAGYTVVDGYAVKVVAISPILVDWVSNFIRIGLMAPIVWPQRATLPDLWRRQWKPAVLVGAISPVSYVLVLFAMQTAPLSHIAPAREVSMLFAALIGGHLLREGDRVPRLIGAACIATGVMALALG